MSSLDQTAISAVDLAIANSVEKEARQGLNQTETKPEASQEVAPIKQPKAEGGKVESPTAAVSALDHMGISSVDLDIAATVEKEVESVKSAKVSEKTVETSEKGKDVEPPEIKGMDRAAIHMYVFLPSFSCGACSTYNCVVTLSA